MAILLEILYGDDFSCVAFTSLLKKLLDEGHLKEEDFEKTEQELLEIIKNSPHKAEFEAIGSSTFKGSSLDSNGRPPVLRKLRYIDPEIQGESATLTEIDLEAKKRLENYLNKTPTKVFYHA